MEFSNFVKILKLAEKTSDERNFKIWVQTLSL